MSGFLYTASRDTTTGEVSFYDKAGNVLCSFSPQSGLVDDPTQPLYLLSKADGSTVRLAQQAADPFEISTDGVTWETATKNSDYTLANGEGLYIRAQSQRTYFPTSGQKMLRILMTGTIEAWNNVNSVLSPDFENISDLSTIGAHCLRGLFSRKLNDSEYDTALVKPPLFPATTLSESCYQHCFYGCQSLTHCATVSATTLAYRACRAMYYECVALAEAVLPPALTVSSNAYSNMFKGCTGLLSIRSFPFTSLDLSGVSHCGEMFAGCTSLTSAPLLTPSVLLGESDRYAPSYNNMFNGCTSLSEVRIAATDIKDQSAYPGTYMWLSNVAPTGDFYCDPNTPFPTDSVSGIPTGWQRLPLT